MERCFACHKLLKKGAAPKVVQVQGESTLVHVGPDCFDRIVSADPFGYQPPLGGPVLVRRKEITK